MRYSVCVAAVVVCFAAGQSSDISTDNYVVYSVAAGKVVTLSAIVEDADTYDVILCGEEHDDAVAHYLEYMLLQGLHHVYGDAVALSLEMFDRDVQVVVDEYLNDLITDKYFLKDSRAWNNYQDYQPLIEFAKDAHIDVIAANAPFRYANLARRKGQDVLNNLSVRAKSFIAPLPYDTATGVHFDKLTGVVHQMPMPSVKQDTMAVDTGMVPKMPVSMMSIFSINQGQSLWNATMAYSICEYLNNHSGKKVFHINGKFHSDEYFGVPEHLEKYREDIKYLVISVFPDSSFPDIDFSAYEYLGDYIIITDPAIPKSF
jgi:uncharacterized iron-regulated protein